MIKKYKNFIIELPPIKIKLDDILKIINIIKKHKLGVLKIYDNKDKSTDLKKIDKEIIYELIIDVSAKNRKDNFKICFSSKKSYIQYHNEIDSDKLLILLKIEETIKEKRFLSLSKKIFSRIRLIYILIFIISVSISPIIKLINIRDQFLNPLIIFFLFLVTFIYFLDFGSKTIIIINIKNKFKRFYYKYYSLNNLIFSFIGSSILFSLFFVIDHFNKYRN